MVAIVTPLSLWVQLGSFFFFMSGIFGDLLVIRFFLVCAYIMLLINSVVGSPLWPDLTGHDGTLAVDSLCWAIMSLYVHGCSLWCLLLDERKVPLSEDEAALWRLFYRTGGLSQRIFHSIVASHLKVVEFEPGQEIPTASDFYVIYQGQVKLEVFDDVSHKYDRIMVSGEMFDVNFLGVLSERTVFDRTKIRCRSVTHTKLFRIHRDDMKKIAQNGQAKGVRQALLINQLSFIVESYAERTALSRRAAETCDHIFEPLEPWEEPRSVLAGSGSALKQTLAHLLFYIKSSFSPPLPFAGHPIGIRQTQLPPPAEQGSSYKRPDEPPRFHFRGIFSQRRMTGRDTSSASDTNSVNEASSQRAAAVVAAVEPTEVDDSLGEHSC